VDLLKQVVDLSLSPELIRTSRSRASVPLQQQISELKKQSPLKGKIEMIKDNYLILSCGKQGFIGYALLKDLNDPRDPVSVFQVGTTHPITVHQMSDHSSRLLVMLSSSQKKGTIKSQPEIDPATKQTVS